jgi:hypothetical protein
LVPFCVSGTRRAVREILGALAELKINSLAVPSLDDGLHSARAVLL